VLDSLAMRAIVEDVSQGFRLLWRVPGFAIPIVLLLCLGITAASVSFSVLDALLLRPLSVLDPESLVRVVQDRPRLELTEFPYSFYLALRQHAKGLRDIRAAQESNTTFLDGESLERLRSGVLPAQARDEAFALYRSTLAANPAIRGDAFGEFRFTPIPRGVSRLRAQFSNGVVFLMIAATLPALHVLRLDPAAALRTDG